MNIKQKNKHMILRCFTPLVALATFAIEIILALFVLVKYRKTTIGILSIGFLVSLALFQLAEFVICGTHVGAPIWSRIGFASTAFLPVIGLHYIYYINSITKTWLLKLLYILTILLAIGFFLPSDPYFGYACLGTYVQFTVTSVFHRVYLWHYIVIVGSSLFILLVYIFSKRKQHIRRLNVWMLVAYLLFLIPTYTLVVLQVITGKDVPSILCGFAILAALVVVGKILPIYYQKLGTVTRPSERP